MRLLWLCNKCLPVVARHRGLEVGNREGWLAGISERFMNDKSNDIEFGVCFPVGSPEEEFTDKFEVSAYGFYEDLEHPENYDSALETRLKAIVEDFKPDLIHIFGTEFPHCRAMTVAFPHKERILIGIQGICTECAEAYFTGIPENITTKATLRDRIKKDNIAAQKRKFEKRGESEVLALKQCDNITGRTRWDMEKSMEINPGAEYFHMNETLRSNFYSGEWNYDTCQKHSIFVSQGDYTIKGLHVLLEALPEIRKAYPDVCVYVAGADIIGFGNIKKTILISEYAKYLKKLVKKEKLNQKLIFTGNLSAEQMKERYLKSHVFVLCSVLENSPNSLGEAMLLGMPCVASAVGGVPSMISEKEGWIYKDCDPGKLAQAVISAFEETDQMSGKTQKQEAAALRARETHDGEKNFQVLMEIYKKILTK